MAEKDFESRAPEFAATLTALFHHQGATLEATVLKAGKVELQQTDFDNWNGGTYTYAFVVRVPVEVFAQIGDRQNALEKSMKEALGHFLRTESNVHIGEVIVMPDAALTTLRVASTNADEEQATWPPDAFRLFISHVSAIKGAAESLKAELARHAISGFVAHSDIEPTRDWQNVIEGALRTMDALVALITPEFGSSKWCDQEVGIAIGRGKLVIPVRAGADPYGFMGRFQGAQGKGLNASDLAGRLFAILAKNDQTSRRLAEAALKAFEKSSSFAEAKQRMTTLEMFDRIPMELLRGVEPSVKTNVDLRDAYTVPARFRDLVLKNGGR